MESKENILKSSLKRRHSVSNDDILKPKRLSISNYFTGKVSNDSLSENLVNQKNITSTCLTENFKVNCILQNNENNILMKERCPMKHLASELNESTQERSNISLYVKKDQSPPLEKNKLSEDFHIFRNKDYETMPDLQRLDSTPENQILSLENFKKLPKPELNSFNNTGSVNLTVLHDLNKSILSKSNSDVTEFVSNDSLNDSFEMIKVNLVKSQSVTPISLCFNSTFLTPETPCDLNTIDLEVQVKPLNQPKSSNQVVRLKGRRRISNSISVSPMFYDKEQKSRTIKNCISKTKNIAKVIRPSIDIEDKNRIEEIPVEKVYKIIENDFTSDSYAFHIIDCRYPYEYGGGHIDSAVNLYTPWQLLNYVFLSNYNLESLWKPLENPEQSMEILIEQIRTIQKPNSNWKYQAFIFHCEFSSIRAPEMARCLRNMDRYVNINCYPHLYFPKIYIMKNGYKEFYSKFKNWCKPCNYIKMDIKDPSKRPDKTRVNIGVETAVEKNSENIDEATRQIRIKEYNNCKKESQEQMQLLSQFMKTNDAN